MLHLEPPDFCERDLAEPGDLAACDTLRAQDCLRVLMMPSRGTFGRAASRCEQTGKRGPRETRCLPITYRLPPVRHAPPTETLHQFARRCLRAAHAVSCVLGRFLHHGAAGQRG